jgi:branched-chain amino acid transport system ATP-binding protein
MSMAQLLSIERLNVHYGRVHALHDVDLTVANGEIVAVLGANGAGKTTLLKTVIGALQPSSGTIRLDGRDIRADETPRRIAAGIALVPEGRQVLVTLTVEENLLIGAVSRRDPGGQGQDLEKIYERFPNLARRKHMEARVLSGGEQQMLAVGRALMARPRLMILDEPSLGLSPLLVQQIYQLLGELNSQGLSFMVVEQNVPVVLGIASRAYVLELGRVVMHGRPADLLRSERLQQAYLGR